MVWLREQGHQVLGVELSSIAVTDFFQEHALPFDIEEMDGLLSYHGQGFQLFCGDFFRLKPAQFGRVEAVYDRAALIALPRKLQQRYVARLLEIVPGRAPILLITLEYDPSEMEGPPFSTPEERVLDLFETTHDVQRLASRDVLQDHPGLAARGLTALRENAYALRPRLQKQA